MDPDSDPRSDPGGKLAPALAELDLQTQHHKSRPRFVICAGAGAGTRTLIGALRDHSASPAPEQFVWLGNDPQSSGARAENLATAATADCAVILIDAGSGISDQTRSQIQLAALLGVGEAVLVVNKMDLVGYAEDRFAEIERGCTELADRFGLGQIVCVPVSAMAGQNVSTASSAMPWYPGAPLLDHLTAVQLPDPRGQSEPTGAADQFESTVVWTGDEPMLRGREYLMAIGAATVGATVARVKYRISVDSIERIAATKLEQGEIGVCDLVLADAIGFDAQRRDRRTDGFGLIDRITLEPVGIGVLHFALRRSQNLRWQSLSIDKQARAASAGQSPTVLWLTGLPAAGKSTIADLIECELHRRGHRTYVLDGDNVRHGLNSDLGFTEGDRVENIRRVAEVARLMLDAGLIVIAAFISPFRAERRMARGLFEPDEFIEVFVDTPLAVAEQRDPKGLYRKARSGSLANFTGIDSPYEPPENAEIHIETITTQAPEAAALVVQSLERSGRLRPPAAQ